MRGIIDRKKRKENRLQQIHCKILILIIHLFNRIPKVDFIKRIKSFKFLKFIFFINFILNFSFNNSSF